MAWRATPRRRDSSAACWPAHTRKSKKKKGPHHHTTVRAAAVTGPLKGSNQFDRDGGPFTAADAQRRDAALLAALLQRMDQRHHDARTARADRMTERTGAAVH